MIVISDVDDVLMAWAERVHLQCIEAGLNPTQKEWTQWHMWEDYGCSLEQWLEVVNGLVVPGGLYHSEPYPGAVEALNKLVANGHEVHLVTARGFHDHSEQIREWTVEWVETFKVPGKLWFSQTKGEVAREIGATHGIDDRYENYLDLVAADVDAYLQNQPHNATSLVPEDRRVNTVSEFVDRILQDAA